MRATEPGVSLHPSVCPLDCGDTCSLTVSVKNGRIEKVRGSDVVPFTRGKICTKVAVALPQQVHGPKRILTPLRRTGEKGSGSFEPISWEEALDTIYQRFQEVIERHGAQAIAPMSYGGPMGLLAHGSMDCRFFNKLGATRVNSRTLCAGVADAAYGSLFGDAGGIPYEELSHSRLIVVWGNNITISNLHLTKLLRDARKAGAKLVVIDPKRIRIADDADLHLPLRPGTDVVLAYAVAAELERQNALSDEFLAANAIGLDAYLAEARKYSMEDAASICGLQLADIHTFVGYWRDIAPAAISIGVAPERNRNGGAGLRTAMALPVLTGNVGPLGAGICNTSGYFPVDTDALQRPDLARNTPREFSLLDLPERILDTNPETPIDAVFIYNHNPVAVHPRQGLMRKALARPDLFVVGHDVSMTDSMAYADIVLPATTHLEYGDIYKAYGQHYLQRSEAVIPPVGEALSNMELFRRLASRFGYTEAAFTETDAEMINAAVDSSNPALAGRAAMTIATDESLNMAFNGAPSLCRGEPADTPSGKIELFDAALEAECGQGVPRYTPLSSSHRFVLISPSSDKRTNSTFGGIAGQDTDLAVEMNPEDAASLALTDGQSVRLHNDQGEVVLPLKICSSIRPDTVYVPKGAWLGSSSTGQTINALIPGHTADIAGGACYNDTQVDIEAVSH